MHQAHHTLQGEEKNLITRSLRLPHIPVTAFHKPIYFYVEFISNSDPHRNFSDQLQSEARTNVDISTSCRNIHVRPHYFILTEACSCRLELAYIPGKISKNRLVCENAVAMVFFVCLNDGFQSTGNGREWLLPIIIISAASVSLLFIFFVHFCVKKKRKSSKNIPNCKFRAVAHLEWESIPHKSNGDAGRTFQRNRACDLVVPILPALFRAKQMSFGPFTQLKNHLKLLSLPFPKI